MTKGKVTSSLSFPEWSYFPPGSQCNWGVLGQKPIAQAAVRERPMHRFTSTLRAPQRQDFVIKILTLKFAKWLHLSYLTDSSWDPCKRDIVMTCFTDGRNVLGNLCSSAHQHPLPWTSSNNCSLLQPLAAFPVCLPNSLVQSCRFSAADPSPGIPRLGVGISDIPLAFCPALPWPRALVPGTLAPCLLLAARSPHSHAKSQNSVWAKLRSPQLPRRGRQIQTWKLGPRGGISEYTDPPARQFTLEVQPSHLPRVWPWANILTFLKSLFLSYEKETIVYLAPKGFLQILNEMSIS